MQRAIVQASVVLNPVHPSLLGKRLILVSILGVAGLEAEGPILVLDPLGADLGSTVLISTDGKRVSELTTKQCPLRYSVLAIEDRKEIV